MSKMSFTLNVALGRFNIPPTPLATQLERAFASRCVTACDESRELCSHPLACRVYVLRTVSLLSEDTAGTYSAAQGEMN